MAPEGADVWMIAASQVSGVPWLGANTMHESLLAGSTGDVTFTLVSATGPGNVGVFTSGSFGKIVDTRWFTVTAASGGSADGEITRTEDQAAVGQVYVKDGKYLIKEAKWTYANGDPCTPNAGPPSAGVSGPEQAALPSALLLLALAAAAAGLRVARS